MASANKPARIAMMPFKVVMRPKISLNDPPVSSICCRWYSVTIQLSKTLYINVLDTPPRILPAKRMNIELDKTVKQDKVYATQKNKQAVFRP
jgi:hypothetical protein